MGPLAATEETLQLQVCAYLRMQYPNVIFHSDSAAGLYMRPGRALKVRMAQSGRAWPDLFIAEPRGAYHGLFIEIKREGARVFLKSGTVCADQHIREQLDMLQALELRGYVAQFGIGFDAIKIIIDAYLKLGSHA